MVNSAGVKIVEKLTNMDANTSSGLIVKNNVKLIQRSHKFKVILWALISCKKLPEHQKVDLNSLFSDDVEFWLI